MIPPNAGPQSPYHFFTVDVEEYFQVSAFARIVPVEYWNAYPRRLDRTMPVLLESLARASAKATFFVLGWVAKHDPHIVKRIRADGHEIASHGFWHRRVSSESPLNGSLNAVEKPSSLCMTARTTACWRSPRVMSDSAGLSWFSRMRE